MDKQEKQKTEKQESKVQGTKVRMDAGRVPKKQQEMNPKSQVCRVMKRQGKNGMNRT